MSVCPFCNPDKARVLSESDVAKVIQDAYPITPGHTLVIPSRHVSSIFDLSSQEQAAIWAMVASVRETLAQQFAIDSFNIGINDGIAAGQTMAHAHIHVIPRRTGDVQDPRGGVRNIIPSKARYWEE